jgi:hypothetical protein
MRWVLGTACRLWCATAITVTALCAPAPLAAQNATTAEVKAAFLYNFARFTEWPADAFGETSAPFVIAISGDEVLRQTIDYLTRGKVISGRPVQTRNVTEPADVASAQILYIGGHSLERAPDLLKEAGRLPVLTIGDSERFCENGGMIAFLIERNRVRFEIQFDATEQARLKVSSRVLSLAKAIHGKS